MKRQKMRSKTFEKRLECQKIEIPVDKIITYEKYVDDDGNIKEIRKDIVDESAKIVADNPAYTDKIEYMQQYGTLQDGKVITYGFARTSEINNLMEITENIIKNNIKKDIDNE